MSNLSFNKFVAQLLIFCLLPGLTSAEVSFRQVETMLFQSPYEALPRYKVSKDLFGTTGSDNNHLLDAARRTLRVQDDLYNFPGERKLLQANGICFTGEWLVTEETGFTGLFRKGVKYPVIARVSVSLGGTRQNDKRAMGMAIKLFPGRNPEQPVKTLNIFLMHNMAGVRTRHVLDLSMDNEPPVGGLPKLKDLGTALRILRDLERADEEYSEGIADAGFRPVAHLAHHQVEGPVRAPKWLRISADEQMPRIDRDDFRDELKLDNYPDNRLIWRMDVAEAHPRGKSKASWQFLGLLRFDRSVTSATCDGKLHFQHPLLLE